MYFKSIELENSGPIDHIQTEFGFNQDGTPKPLILVGANGSGKSIFLSYLVNCLIIAKQEVFDNTEVEHGKVYKLRTPRYIKSGTHYSYAAINFTKNISIEEIQLSFNRKSEFTDQLQYSPSKKIWSNLSDNNNELFTSNFDKNPSDTEQLISKQCCLFFPVNRFEEPAWINHDNLIDSANYTDIKKIKRQTNRKIICSSHLRSNESWLLDLILDRHLYETNFVQLPVIMAPNQPHSWFKGQSTELVKSINEIISIILQKPRQLRFGVGDRKYRRISIEHGDKSLIPNIFQLSTGETQLLNLFLTILRDHDFSEGSYNNFNDLKGIVIIDEIDIHLHTSHQKDVLPTLFKLFPKIQFIITTHSPLFLMGMEEEFGEEKFDIVNLPDGMRISPSDFSEFVAAHNTFKETAIHRQEIQDELEKSSKPVVFVEGDYDVRYLNKAAELLGKTDLLDKIRLIDGDGYGNLDKIWKSYNNAVSDILPSRMLLLYDCDIKKAETRKNKVFRKVIPSQKPNPISIGIENLFPLQTINKIEEEKPQFIDVELISRKRIRGKEIPEIEIKSINKNEKRNLCDWLCEHGDEVDFVHFSTVFELIDETLISD